MRACHGFLKFIRRSAEYKPMDREVGRCFENPVGGRQRRGEAELAEVEKSR